jgi:VanZ family protein
MTSPFHRAAACPEHFRWSLRILVLSLTGILFLTLYPFRLTSRVGIPGATLPLLLEGKGKPSGALDVFLNIILFVPYGFGLAGFLQARGKTRIRMMAITLAAGALLSYGIEVLQFYIPERDSGWEDVVTNSTGSLVGFLVFQLCGTAVIRFLNSCESVVGAAATAPNTTLALLLYFGAWFGVSAGLQRDTALSNWNLQSLLSVRSSPSSQSTTARKGEVYELEFWDHAVKSDFAKRLTSTGIARTSDPEPLVAYTLSAGPPFQDRRQFLPDLNETRKMSISPGSKVPPADDTSSITSVGPVSALVETLEKTRQFAVRVRYDPARIGRLEAPIISISPVSGPPDLEIRQENASLVFWFRNPVSARRSLLAWSVPHVFEAQVPRDFLFSYDGSNLDLAIDGRLLVRVYCLGPGAVLAQRVRRIKTNELRGYRYIYYALMFLPAGCLLGFARRDKFKSSPGWLLFMVVGYCLPPVLLEVLLVRVGGQMLSPRNIGLALLITCAGSVWINLGGGKAAAH